jgi:hypothetical protein
VREVTALSARLVATDRLRPAALIAHHNGFLFHGDIDTIAAIPNNTSSLEPFTLQGS